MHETSLLQQRYSRNPCSLDSKSSMTRIETVSLSIFSIVNLNHVDPDPDPTLDRDLSIASTDSNSPLCETVPGSKRDGVLREETGLLATCTLPNPPTRNTMELRRRSIQSTRARSRSRFRSGRGYVPDPLCHCEAIATTGSLRLACLALSWSPCLGSLSAPSAVCACFAVSTGIVELFLWLGIMNRSSSTPYGVSSVELLDVVLIYEFVVKNRIGRTCSEWSISQG